MIRHFSFNEIQIWVFLLIINISISSITSKLVPIQKGDPTEWREYGAQANFAQFNSMYAISINEEQLRSDKYCSGSCNLIIDSTGMKNAQNLTYPNQCSGSLRFCWLERVTEKRNKAYEDYRISLRPSCSDGIWCQISDWEIKRSQELLGILHHTGNICKCLCERDDYSNTKNQRGELLDSICFDPVSVDDGYVATGARFKRYGNVIYLQLQQGILSQGKIDPITLKWTTSNNCNLKKVVDNFQNYGHYDTLEIILNDLTLLENAVVTGVTLGDSLRGKYIDDNGNIDENESEVSKRSQCYESATDFIHSNSDVLPSTSLIGNNYERSEPCKYKINFDGTRENSDNIQHIVPYVDLQEIVTDQNSPKPIQGIGWYYRGHPGYGGFLALKIFTKE